MLDDLRRALRMDSPAPRLSESNLRKLSRGLRSSKKSRLSLETQSVQDGSLGGRSVSLSTLLPSGGGPGSAPRVDKLQSLEAKMASIEVSLGWRRRREALLETLPRAARDLVRELDTLHQTVREKENCIQGLRTQITNLGGTVSGATDGGGGGGGGRGGVVSESERKTIQERLDKVEAEVEAKKVAVKNLKLTLDKIDITDNIDVRIRAAELEYELEREELNILNLKEEASLLTTRLQESCLTTSLPGGPSGGQTKPRVSFQELLSVPGNSSIVAGVSLVSSSLSHTPGNPPFHVTFRPPFGCVIDWATDDTRLKKGDRIIEINNEIVFGKNIDDVTKLMSSSAHLSIVVSRPMDNPNGVRKVEKQLEEKVKEGKELVAKLDKALKERDTFKNDNTRLNHRISYLEDQVTELQSTLQKAKDAAIVTGSPNEVLTPSHPGATIIQVFQKGPQTMAVAGAEVESPESRVQEYPTLPRLKSPSGSSHDSNPRLDERAEEGPPQDRPPQERPPEPPSESPCASQRSLYSSTTPHSPSEQSPTQGRPHPGGTLDYTPTIRPRRSLDEFGDYQRINVKGHADKTLRGTSASDYDCIEKLRDKLTEKSPSYSYKSPTDFSEEAPGCRSEDELSLKSKRSFYEYDPPNASRSSPFSKHPRRRDSHESYSRPPSSSRESLLSSPTFRDTDTRSSRGANGGERPGRRVISPAGAEDSRPMRPRPVPPKKPERLSLQRTTSMQSVEDPRPCSRASSVSTHSRATLYRGDTGPSDPHTGESLYASVSINSSSPRAPSEDSRSYHHPDEDPYRRPPSGPPSEEPPPTPSPRNLSQPGPRRSSLQHYRESRRLTVSSLDGFPPYESPYASPHPPNGPRSSNGPPLPQPPFPSRSKSPSAALFLDASMGLDLHQEVRAQPLYEFLRRGAADPTGAPSPPGQRRGPEREGFEAPPTPNTPPRGINLSVRSSGKEGEEWC